VSKPPTPQAISALLRKAGFARSNHGDKGVMWNAMSTGYRVTGRAPDAEPRFVVVLHFDEGQYGFRVDYERHLETAVEQLSRYAEVISAAGWDAELKHGDPKLIVTAQEDSR
jgi:hypothetical protein